MNDDTIYRQAAIDAFDGVKVDKEYCDEYAIGYNDGIDFAVSRLSVLPSAQSERKTGKWEGTLLVKNSGRVKCSECYAIYDWDTQAQYFKYCPNCGADMRGAERQEDG